MRKKNNFIPFISHKPQVVKGFSTNVVLIPEPSTIILAGTGLFFLARRFRKHLCLH
jgi:hypothetical protein